MFHWTTENVPVAFGLYHFIWVCVLYVLLLAAWFLHNQKRAVQDRIILGMGLLLLLFEAGKQVLYITEVNDSGGYWWFVFPLQPCSYGMYALILAGCLKSGKVKSAIASFCVFYGLFFGISSTVHPGAIFDTSYSYLLFQSPLHHTVLTVAGVYMLMCRRVRPEWKFFLRATAVFAAVCLVSLGINIAVHPYFASHTTNGVLNAFYMGPYEIWDIPVFGPLLEGRSDLAHILFYVIGNILLAVAVWGVAFVVRIFARFVSKRVNSSSNRLK